MKLNQFLSLNIIRMQCSILRTLTFEDFLRWKNVEKRVERRLLTVTIGPRCRSG